MTAGKQGGTADYSGDGQDRPLEEAMLMDGVKGVG